MVLVRVPKLFELRRAAMLSQEELADRAGIDRRTVSHGEQGGELRYASVRKLAAALGVTSRQLTGGRLSGHL